MFRGCISLLVVTVFACGGFLAADEPDFLQQALALEKTMQKIIVQAEPSIACILVSRSDAYYREFGLPAPTDENPGKLGAFDSNLLADKRLPQEVQEKLRRMLDLADPAVVPQSFGSGVVIDKLDGLILTNYHVVRDAVKIFVRLPGKIGSYADIHAADPRSDLAVLRLLDQTLGQKLVQVRLGDGGKVQRGQFILSLANPFAAGFRDGQPSASWGILSNVRRRSPGMPREEDGQRSLHHYGILLQTDARLNLGCSGGALLNLHGEMIGLTTSLAAIHGGETPGGFAIPLDTGLRRIIDVLKRGEEVEYGFLGVAPIEVNGQVAIDRVTGGSPAALDGKLTFHDRILEVNDQPIHDVDDLFLQLGTQLAGSRVRLKIKRGFRAEETVEVTLAKLLVPGKRIVSSLKNRPWERGLRVDYASLVIQPRAASTDSIPSGVLVSEVKPGSPADLAKLRSGNIVTHVNNQRVLTPAGFYQAVQKVNGRLELTLGGASSANPPVIIAIP